MQDSELFSEYAELVRGVQKTLREVHAQNPGRKDMPPYAGHRLCRLSSGAGPLRLRGGVDGAVEAGELALAEESFTINAMAATPMRTQGLSFAECGSRWREGPAGFIEMHWLGLTGAHPESWRTGREGHAGKEREPVRFETTLGTSRSSQKSRRMPLRALHRWAGLSDTEAASGERKRIVRPLGAGPHAEISLPFFRAAY